jgi:hypothetical protein
MHFLNRVIFSKIQKYVDLSILNKLYIRNIEDIDLTNKKLIEKLNIDLEYNIDPTLCVICNTKNDNICFFCDICTSDLKTIYCNSNPHLNPLLNKFCNKLYWGCYPCDDWAMMGCFAYLITEIFEYNSIDTNKNYNENNILKYIIKLNTSRIFFSKNKQYNGSEYSSKYITNYFFDVDTVYGNVVFIYHGFDVHDVSYSSYSNVYIDYWKFNGIEETYKHNY